MTKLYISDIYHDSIVDGEGFRNVVFVSGCWWNCPQCHNPSTHSKTNGKLMSIEEIINDLFFDNNDITLSGGDPLTYQLKETTELVKEIKKRRPSINIWCYTGYKYEDIRHFEILKYIDILVDGKFKIEQKNLSLLFRGSANQRIIDVQDSLVKNKTILWIENK